MNENDLENAAKQAGKVMGGAPEAANKEVQKWAVAVPYIRWGLAGAVVLLGILYLVG